MNIAIITEAVFIGVALAMDALAASVALGAAGRKSFDWRKIAITAGFFGFFQFLMPLIGFIGSSFAEHLVYNYGSIVAGVLLILIGGKMFFDKADDSDDGKKSFSLQKLFVLALATSIDALLVGVSFRCLHRTSIIADIIIIGVVTALISAAGCLAGRWSGKLLGKHCPFLGGGVLVMLGLKVIFFS